LRTGSGKERRFTNSRGDVDRENGAMKLQIVVALALGSAVGFLAPSNAATPTMVSDAIVVMAQAADAGAQNAVTPQQRMARRFPQPVRVGDLIGLPMLDDSASTLGFVRQVVRTSAGKIELIVSYSRWFGWFGRPVAVPIEVVGIEGRQLASLDMPRSEYAAAPTWQAQEATVLPDESTIRIALARN
jgi:hypothetical protein